MLTKLRAFGSFIFKLINYMLATLVVKMLNYFDLFFITLDSIKNLIFCRTMSFQFCPYCLWVGWRPIFGRCRVSYEYNQQKVLNYCNFAKLSWEAQQKKMWETDFLLANCTNQYTTQVPKVFYKGLRMKNGGEKEKLVIKLMRTFNTTLC